MDVPDGLDAGGRALWADLTALHEDLDPTQLVTLLEVCRAKDRLDKLDLILTGDVATWARVVDDHGVYDLRINAALNNANTTANLMKQLIAALRLPDENGKRAQRHGPRVQKPSIPGGTKVSSLDRMRKTA